MNGPYYKNKEYDRLFEKARLLQESPERTEMYKKLARMVAEDCPVILGVNRIAVNLRQGWIRNSVVDEFTYPRAKYLKIDPDARKRYGN
jgi:ABC-type oligopeptide transport system substrate-binding subunit